MAAAARATTYGARDFASARARSPTRATDELAAGGGSGGAGAARAAVVVARRAADRDDRARGRDDRAGAGARFGVRMTIGTSLDGSGKLQLHVSYWILPPSNADASNIDPPNAEASNVAPHVTYSVSAVEFQSLGVATIAGPRAAAAIARSIIPRTDCASSSSVESPSRVHVDASFARASSKILTIEGSTFVPDISTLKLRRARRSVHERRGKKKSASPPRGRRFVMRNVLQRVA